MPADTLYKLYLDAWKINRSNPLKSIEIGYSILKLADEHSNEEGKALGYKILSVANIWISKNELAQQYAYQALDIFEKLGLKNMLQMCIITWEQISVMFLTLIMPSNLIINATI